MISCDHFIYTAAPVKGKSTYQVTAKSSDISEHVIKELFPHVFPADVNLSKFKESRSLLLLDNDKIAYCRVRNIGIGYDGRSDTLYSHTIIIGVEDFKKINNDSRILHEHYIEKPSLVGKIEKINIEPKEIPINFNLLNVYSSSLHDILSSLFNKQNVALVSQDETQLIQEILALIPPSLRILPFNTYLDDPQKQSKYQFIMIQKRFKRNLQDNFRLINIKLTNVEQHPKKSKSLFDEALEYLVGIVYLKEKEKLFQINDNFEKILSGDLKDKLILVTNCFKFSYTIDENLKQKYADAILEVIKEFDRDTKSEYFNKIKQYSKQYELLESKLQEAWDPSITLAEAFLLLPTKFMLDLYKSFFGIRKSDD